MYLTQVSTYSLSTVLKRVKQIIISQTQNKNFWVKSQISKISNDKRGNYYLELIESEQGVVIAKCDAIIWSTQYTSISNKLNKDLDNVLKNGSEILCYASVEYSEVYGLRLKILDIDLSFSLGEIERRKQETLLFLQKNELIDRNKQTKLPIVVQKIALIGSPGSAGHADFVNQLKDNELNIDFKITNYPCSVQGEKALAEIIEQLHAVDINYFDMVAIVRGGGSKFDLEIFNNLNLAKTIAKYPIPILTGIGHETDLSVADIVAHKYLKTPTALASFIIDQAHKYKLNISYIFEKIKENFNQIIKNQQHKTVFLGEQIKHKSQNITRNKRINLHQISSKITYTSQDLIANDKIKLNTFIDKTNFYTKNNLNNNTAKLNQFGVLLESVTKNHVQKNQIDLKGKSNLLQHFINKKLNNEKQRIEKLNHVPETYNPQQILKRGYVIARKNKTIITDHSKLQNEDQIELELANKIITFTIANLTESEK